MDYIEIKEFLRLSGEIPVLDVRSPGEYFQGHIPGAVNIPLFDDEERSQVGKLFKKRGRTAAVRKGLEIVGPKMPAYLDKALMYCFEGELLIHCWRGGMRSESMAWLFEKADLKCKVLSGGYKSYRRYIRENIFQGKEMLVIGGLTGSGKTLMLREMQTKGEPVIDLEKLASHRGSAFGGIGLEEQPNTEQFENNLFREVSKIKHSYFWLEDESLQIGKIFIPQPFFNQMMQSKLLFVDVPQDHRIDVLVSEYAGQDKELIERAILKLEPRLGNLAARKAIEALNTGTYSETARILLNYYDKTYLYGLNQKNKSFVHRLDLTGTAKESYADTIIEQKNILLGKIP